MIKGKILYLVTLKNFSYSAYNNVLLSKSKSTSSPAFLGTKESLTHFFMPSVSTPIF